ncbi:hypothetical protein Tco_0764398 [Tanacetum coccineum]
MLKRVESIKTLLKRLTDPGAKKNWFSKVVLISPGLVSVNTARQVNVAHTKTTMNAARPMSYLSKKAHSTVKRPIHKNTTFKNSNFNQRVNTVKDKNVNTVRPKAVANDARPKAVVNVVKGNNVNAVKASARNPQMDLQDKGVIDSGCSRHMTGNMSYLTNYDDDRLRQKPVNGDVQLQALVDGKKIIITESTVRRDLQLEDAEGVDCPPNATIFEQLAVIGYEQYGEELGYCGKIFNVSKGKVFLEGKHHYSKQWWYKIKQKWVKVQQIPLIPITPTIIQPQKKQKPRKPKRKDTQIPQSSGPTKHVADEAVYKELDDSLVRAATTASSLEAEQDSGNIIKTRSKATPNEAGSQGTTSGGGPRRQETIRDTIAQTGFENVSKLSNDPLLVRGNTLRSGEDNLKLNELMELCTNLQQRVLDLETTKTTQANEIASLKRMVKKLEKKDRSRTHKLKRLYKVSLSARVESSRDEVDLGEDASKQGRRIYDIDADEDITLVNDQDDADMFDVKTLTGDEVLAELEVVVKDVNLTVDEVTLAQALAALKSVKPKVKANVVEEPSIPVSAASIKDSAATTTTTAIIPTP